MVRKAFLALAVLLTVAAALVVGFAVYDGARSSGSVVVARAQEPARIIDARPFQGDAPLLVSPPPVAGADSSGQRIQIPDLGVNLEIVPGDGVEVPLFKAAHYPGSAWPGESGRIILYAHARDGMFGPLFNAKVGQSIRLVQANGKVKNFQIVQYYPRWPDTDLRWLAPTDYPELVLITCTSYNSLDPRIIVVARPVG